MTITLKDEPEISIGITGLLGREFLIKEKICCGSGCFLCPYIPKHIAGSTKIDKKFLDKKKIEE